MGKGTQFYCRCKDCKRMRRKGLILGSRHLRHFTGGGIMSDPVRAYGAGISVSDYVPYHRWQKGRKPTPPV